jgi:hypothetical protein
MMLREPEVIRTALVAAAMVQACTVGYEHALSTLLIQQFAALSDEEVALVAKELGI